jgi:predicted ATP-grasp superfamily ATP-dependent carboligase
MNPSLLILGASTRAAAFSAIRAGFQPVCGDMFADADLQRFATVIAVPDYPHELASATSELAVMPWMYTGALENWPSQIKAVSTRHVLLGNDEAALKKCRDPWLLQELMRQNGLPTLELRRNFSAPPRDGTWICKPVQSSAGRGIAVWTPTSPVPEEPHYFQQFRHGVPISAAFLGGKDASGAQWAELLGTSVQLSGMPDLHAPQFGYCGSLVPSRVQDLGSIARRNPGVCSGRFDEGSSIEQRLRDLGQIVADASCLHGLFGLDFIWNGSDLWVLEINPRYTASMELLEQALGKPLLDWHVRSCQPATGASHSSMLRAEIRAATDSAAQRDSYFGKLILYANRSAIAPDLVNFIPKQVDLGAWPELADIPVAGSPIETGQPVFTCLRQSNDPDHLLAELLQRTDALWQRFPSR